MILTWTTVLVTFSVLIQAESGHPQYVIQYSTPKTRDDIRELCAVEMDALVAGLENIENWALSMLDASSKIPVGLLAGNILDLGNFDQCLAIKYETQNFTIKGKHCLRALNIRLDSLTSDINRISSPPNIMVQLREDDGDNIPLSLSLCIPDACLPSEVSSYLNLEAAFFNDGVCQTNEPTELNGGDIAAATFLSLILFIMVASTIYDFWLYQTDQTTAHPIFVAFSIITNGRKILAVDSNNARQLSSLHGLRCISMIWVVAGHRFSMIANLPAMNLLEMLEWPSKLYSQYIQSAHVAVDTFFFLSGMMISYGYFRTVNKPKKISFVPLYYLHRYLRITPAVGVLFFVSVTVWRHVGSGPLWPGLTDFTRTPCLKWWWTYFLYVQNYVNYDDLCIIPTWYLSADMQMFLLSPFIMLPLGYLAIKKSKKLVYITCACLVVVFMIIQAVIKLNVESKNEYMTHERLSVWMIGFTLGILLEEIKSRKLEIRMNSKLNLLVWIVVLVGMISILLTMHDVRLNPERLETNMFDTFHRPGWSLGLAWIVYSCTIGYGGFVNWFLSLPAFQVLSKMTYCMYLVHSLPIMLSTGQMRLPTYFSELNIIYYFCGDIILTLIFALVWVLAFESLMITIERYIFGQNREPRHNTKKISASEKIDFSKIAPKTISLIQREV